MDIKDGDSNIRAQETSRPRKKQNKVNLNKLLKLVPEKLYN